MNGMQWPQPSSQSTMGSCLTCLVNTAAVCDLSTDGSSSSVICRQLLGYGLKVYSSNRSAEFKVITEGIPVSSSHYACIMDFYVDYSSKNDKETGRTKLSVSDFDTTSIRDVKYAIQAAIQAPVCDQQLFYQGQPVTDDDMTLSRLYFREGDYFKVQFLAAADIRGMSELLEVLKNSTQRVIVEKLQRQLPNIEEDSSSLWRFYDRLVYAVEGLASFFFPWRCLRSVAQRHFFVQEGGFDAFLDVFKFTRQLYAVEHLEDDFNVNENSVEATMIQNQLKHHVNRGQLVLQLCCLSFLWNFGETPQDRKFVLSKDVFPLAVDALLLQPGPLEDCTGHIDIASLIVSVNETAVGCCGGLIEFDSNIQEEASKMQSLIDKLLFMIDRCQSDPAGYTLFSSQVASNTIFYCTFNVKSAQPLVDCGALEKMLNITKKLLNDEDSNTPLRYYCCLFLARLRSAPLVKLDRDACAAVDKLIDVFLEQHVPNEISKWEEEMSFVWMTMVPLVHLAFAAGKDYYCSHGLQCDISQSESKQSETVKSEVTEDHTRELQSSLCPLLNSFNRVGSCETSYKRKKIEDNTSMEIETSGIKDQFTWPGSLTTHKLGIFSLMHMLSLKENQQLALAENLLPYLVCLSWHLKDNEKEKLTTSLAHCHNVSWPPSLKVIAKSMLALVYGLDTVFKL